MLDQYKNVGNLKQLYFKHLQISGTNLLLVLTVPFISCLWSVQSGFSAKQMMSLRIPSQSVSHNSKRGKKKKNNRFSRGLLDSGLQTSFHFNIVLKILFFLVSSSLVKPLIAHRKVCFRSANNFLISLWFITWVVAGSQVASKHTD